MTEFDKLRALLAEALGAIDEGYDRGIPSIIQRIDVALAEPVVASRMAKPSNTTWARFAYDFRERAEKAERERDEARAEAKALREVIETAGNRLRACGEQLTEHAYQEMASVLFDLPLVMEDEP